MNDIEYLRNELLSYNYMIRKLKNDQQENVDETHSFIFRTETIDRQMQTLNDNERSLINAMYINKVDMFKIIETFQLEHKINNFNEAKIKLMSITDEILRKMLYD